MELDDYRQKLTLPEQIELDHFIRDLNQFIALNRFIKKDTPLSDEFIIGLFEAEMRDERADSTDIRMVDMQITYEMKQLLAAQPSLIWWCTAERCDFDCPNEGEVFEEIFIRTLDNRYSWIGAVMTPHYAEQVYLKVYAAKDHEDLGYREYFKRHWSRIIVAGDEDYHGPLTEKIIEDGLYDYLLLWHDFDARAIDTELVFDPAADYTRKSGETADYYECSEDFLEAQFRDILHNRQDYTPLGEKKLEHLRPEERHRSKVHTFFVEDDEERFKIIRLLKLLPRSISLVDKLRQSPDVKMEVGTAKELPAGQIFVLDLKVEGTRQYYRFVGIHRFEAPAMWPFAFDPKAISWVFNGKYEPIDE